MRELPRSWIVAVAAIAALGVVGGPASAVAHAAVTPMIYVHVGGPPAVVASGWEVSVTWGGQPISFASSPADAYALAPGGSVTVVFSYQGASENRTPTNASLLLLYFGLTLSTQGAEAYGSGGSGGAMVNWSFGSLDAVLQGVYEVVAQLTDARGDLLFSEPFYINAQAPWVIGSAVTIFGLVLGIAEAYWIVVMVRTRGGRRWRRSRR